MSRKIITLRFNGRNYSGFRGINLKETNGAIRFETPLTTPTTTSGERLIYIRKGKQNYNTPAKHKKVKIVTKTGKKLHINMTR